MTNAQPFAYLAPLAPTPVNEMPIARLMDDLNATLDAIALLEKTREAITPQIVRSILLRAQYRLEAEARAMLTGGR